jgi:broad specificity phosphatase PhoE
MTCPKFLFVRHGEAMHNVGYHAEGASAYSNPSYEDANLTSKGLEQAKAMANTLFEHNVKVLDIWSSPLTRCIQTAEEIFEETGAQNIYLHDALLERQGENHVCNYRKSLEVLKGKYEYLNLDFLPSRPFFYEEREPWSAVKYRMYGLILMLAQMYAKNSSESCIVLSTHHDAIYALIGKSLRNCEYVVMSLEEIQAIVRGEGA